MKICPTCSKKFDDKYKFCPEDGTLLMSVVEEKDPMIGKTLKNKYVIEELVTTDSIGRTFKGTQKLLGRKVFIEIFNKKFTLKKEFRQKLEEAIQKYSNLQHGNIAVVYDLDETEDGRFYVVSEFVEGKYLSDILKEGTLSEERALNIFYQITDALYLAHKNLIEHGFLTPNQIIINKTPDEKEVVQIYNFGISKLLLEEKMEKYFVNGEKVFTIEEVTFLAPEHIKAKPDIDDLSDIYSLGVIMYYALTGFPPFQADSPEAMIEAILTLEPIPLNELENFKDISKNWDSIILKCLAKNKENRFQSASEIKKELIKLKKILERKSEPTIKVIAEEEKQLLVEKEMEPEKTTILGAEPEIHHKTPKLSETLFIEEFEVEEKLKQEKEKREKTEEIKKTEETAEKIPPIPESESVSMEEKEKMVIGEKMEGEVEAEEVEKTEIIDHILDKVEGEEEALTLTEMMPPSTEEVSIENAETVMVERAPKIEEGKDEKVKITPQITSDKTAVDIPSEKLKKEAEKKLEEKVPEEEEKIEELPEEDSLETIAIPTPNLPPPPPPPTPPKKTIPDLEEPTTPEIKLKDEGFEKIPTEEKIIYEDEEEKKIKETVEREKISTKTKKSSKSLFIIIGVVGIVLILLVIGLLLLLKTFFTPHFGVLEIKSNPPAAKIYLDGAPIGNTPYLQEKIDVGKHSIVLRKDGFKPLKQEINIEAGKKTVLELTLVPYGSQKPVTSKMIGLEEIQQLLDKAQMAYNEKRIFSPEDDCALYYINKILELDPQNESALNLKDKIIGENLDGINRAARRGNWYLVKKQSEILLKYFPDNEDLNNLYNKAKERIANYIKRKKQTIIKFKKLVERSIRDKKYVTPPGDNAVEYLYQILRLDKNNYYAKKTLKKVKDLASFQIDTAIINSQWERANEITSAYLKLFPGDVKIKRKSELIAQKYKEYLKKLAEIKKQKEKERKIQQAKDEFYKGLSNYKSGKYVIAIKHLLNAVPNLPNPSKAYFYLGASFLELKNYQKAIEYFKKTLSINPRDYTAAYELGVLYLSKGEYQKSLKYLKIAKSGIIPGVSAQKVNNLYNKAFILHKMSEIFRTSIPAEHKHFIGSCSGYVIFTEDTFRYETTSSHSMKAKLKDLQDISFGETSGFRFKYKGKKYKFKIKDNKKFIILKSYLKKYLKILKGN